MLTTFNTITPHLKFKSKLISIDNLIFKFHYRASFLILLACTILVTSRQYIGEHIRCITGGTIPEHVINTFCFFTSTFTVVRHFNETLLSDGLLPHPGVGPVVPEDNIRHHAYYQWVPFFLFAQAIMFYLPHLMWKSWEGEKIKSLVDGLQRIALSRYLRQKTDMEIKNPLRDTTTVIPSKFTVRDKVTRIRRAFYDHIKVNSRWAQKFLFCEFLNIANLVLQIYTTNRFLGGTFYTLGVDFIREDFQGTMDVLDIVFPKVTKCHFFKYGPSGTIQKHDALCVMALNVINEKIFVFLWFWFAFLLFVSLIGVLYRLATIIFHSRSAAFNGYVFAQVCPGRLNPFDMITVTNRFAFNDWLFLYYLAKNMEPYVFRDMLIRIARELRNEGGIESDTEDEDEEQEEEEEQDDELDNQPNNDILGSKYNLNPLLTPLVPSAPSAPLKKSMNDSSLDINEMNDNERNNDTLDRKARRANETLVNLLNEKPNSSKDFLK